MTTLRADAVPSLPALVGPGLRSAALELFAFGWKLARSCLFAGAFFLILAISKVAPLGSLARYDFILFAAIAVQVLLVATKQETLDELKVICLFHGIGLALEVFKTHPMIGSWSYPEPGGIRLFSVPLYSGFMYAAVGSFMCQAWRHLKLELTGFPPYATTLPLCAAIYLNFFTHHFFVDLRWVLIASVLWVFRRTRVTFVALEQRRSMPVSLSFLLLGFFIWIAENASTYLGAWVYPEQVRAWTWVSLGKISSWSLLAIISFIIVADLKALKAQRARVATKRCDALPNEAMAT